jgi:zinc ribbon protein
VRRCAQCSSELADDFRFCPHCGAAQRSKVVEYFRGHSDIDDGWLRVSAYLTSPRHLRLSIWRSQEAEAAISLDPGEADRLGRFLLTIASRSDAPRIAQSVRRSAQALRDVFSR